MLLTLVRDRISSLLFFLVENYEVYLFDFSNLFPDEQENYICYNIAAVHQLITPLVLFRVLSNFR
jgi:hypothetical protein